MYCITRVTTLSHGGYIVRQDTDRVGPFSDRMEASQWIEKHVSYQNPPKPGAHVRIKVDCLYEGMTHPDDFEDPK